MLIRRRHACDQTAVASMAPTNSRITEYKLRVPGGPYVFMLSRNVASGQWRVPVALPTRDGDNRRRPLMPNRLASWFTLWHPRYRQMLIASLLAAAVGCVMIFLDDTLLAWLTAALAGGGDGGGRSIRQRAARHPRAGPSLADRPAAAYSVGPGHQSSGDQLGRLPAVGGHRQNGHYLPGGLEREVLDHLLRQDDAFFGNHSPAETVKPACGRLTADRDASA